MYVILQSTFSKKIYVETFMLFSPNIAFKVYQLGKILCNILNVINLLIVYLDNRNFF